MRGVTAMSSANDAFKEEKKTLYQEQPDGL